MKLKLKKSRTWSQTVKRIEIRVFLNYADCICREKTFRSKLTMASQTCKQIKTAVIRILYSRQLLPDDCFVWKQHELHLSDHPKLKKLRKKLKYDVKDAILQGFKPLILLTINKDENENMYDEKWRLEVNQQNQIMIEGKTKIQKYNNQKRIDWKKYKNNKEIIQSVNRILYRFNALKSNSKITFEIKYDNSTPKNYVPPTMKSKK